MDGLDHNTALSPLVELLRSSGCLLVVRGRTGEVTTYARPGVRDLVWLLDNAPQRLRGATVADKVIGKAAAGLLVQGGVACVYGEVMSELALPLLDAVGMPHHWGTLVPRIVIPQGDTRCPLEQIVASATTAPQVEQLLRDHFAEMRAKAATPSIDI